MDKFPDGETTCARDGAALVPSEVLEAVDRDLPAGATVGEYRVEGKLGAGAFGTVYRAVHPLIGKAAAVKVLSRELSSNPQMVSRFVAEARAVNQIQHKNIIDIFAFGRLPDGRQFYVMELLDGVPFDQYLAARGPLTLAAALPILRGIARAVDAAHAKGILHRDLKPENVFVTFDEDGGVHPKLLDFGLVKLLSNGDEGQHKTKTGTPMGTPYYMSPEQCRGKEVDGRTDVYAFGAMVFEVLTGKLPFDAEAAIDILMKHLAEPPPRASAIAPHVSPLLDGPVAAMLAKNPEERPRSLGAALDMLVRASGETLPASSASIATPELLAAELKAAIVAVPRVETGTFGADAATIGEMPTARPPAASQTFLGAEADVASARRSRSRLFVGFGAAALTLLVVVGFSVSKARAPRAGAAVALPSASAGPTEPRVTTTPEMPQPPGPAERPTQQTVDLTIESSPPLATVALDGKTLGAAPGPFKVKPGSALQLAVSAPGHRTRNLEVTPTANMLVEVTLERAVQAPRTGTKRPSLHSDLEGFDKR